MPKIERKFLKHYINATPGEATATYEVLGKDLEEMNVELNPETEKKKNILGEVSIVTSSYEPQSSVEPFYAEDDSALFAFLQDIIDGRKTLDALKTDVVEVHTWEGSGASYKAFKEEAFVEISQYGGDTKGYGIPFNIHYTGNRVEGTFNPTTKVFTPTVNLS